MQSAQASWAYPDTRPYRILAIIGLLGTLQCFGVVLAPPDQDVQRGVYLVIGVVALTVSIVLWVAGPRLGPVVLHIVVLITTFLVCGLAAIATTGQGQLLVGFSLTLLGLFTGYFLSWRLVIVQAVVALTLYVAALILNPLLVVPWYGLVVILVNVGVTVIVARLVGRLRTMAVQDPLTGAQNRQGLAADADLAHQRDVRAHVPTAVVEIDLDGFKRFNDTYGHEAGDALLAGLVEDWRQILRRTDILARIGGDEFVIVLPATSAGEATALLDRMRQANPAQWTHGLVEWRPGERLPDALRHADLAMYLHKASRPG